MILIKRNNNKEKIYLFLINNINMFGYYNPQNYAAAVSNRIDELNKKVVYTLQHVEILEQLLLSGGISIPNGDGSKTNYNQQMQTLKEDFNTLTSFIYNVRSMIPLAVTEQNVGNISKLQKDYNKLSQQLDDLSDVVHNLPTGSDVVDNVSTDNAGVDYSQQIQTLTNNLSTLKSRVDYIDNRMMNSVSGGEAKNNYELTNDVTSSLIDVGNIVNHISVGNWTSKIQSLTNRVNILEGKVGDMTPKVDLLQLLPFGPRQITWLQLIDKVENFPNGITEAQYNHAVSQAQQVPSIQAALLNVVEQLDSQNLLDMQQLLTTVMNSYDDLVVLHAKLWEMAMPTN
jgi:hypothetical protein